ncbi:MAG TPA: MarR family transcriptional regulator [Pseudogracilibacillus sp.]|nr:MarR family transcriptional regulator [Pseudogracilibacillus sp.]
MKDDDLTLENQLSFILYVCSKETIRRYQIYLEELNLTYTQYLVLLVLWNGDNIPVNELGKRLYLDSGTLTPMLKKLETKNLLKRVRDTVDGRNVMVTLTKEGRELNEKVKDIPQTIFDETGIPKEEANEMITKLNDILKRVK